MRAPPRVDPTSNIPAKHQIRSAWCTSTGQRWRLGRRAAGMPPGPADAALVPRLVHQLLRLLRSRLGFAWLQVGQDVQAPHAASQLTYIPPCDKTAARCLKQ